MSIFCLSVEDSPRLRPKYASLARRGENGPSCRMIAQPLAIHSKDQRSFAIGALFTARRFPLALVLICVGAGLLSVILGPDNYWDLRFYHLYGPWAYLHDRYLYDIGPAQEEG